MISDWLLVIGGGGIEAALFQHLDLLLQTKDINGQQESQPDNESNQAERSNESNDPYPSGHSSSTCGKLIGRRGHWSGRRYGGIWIGINDSQVLSHRWSRLYRLQQLSFLRSEIADYFQTMTHCLPGNDQHSPCSVGAVLSSPPASID